MKAIKLISGLSIFLRYKPNFWVEAGHEIIYGPHSEDEELDLNDLETKHLKEDGWFIDVETGYWATFC